MLCSTITPWPCRGFCIDNCSPHAARCMSPREAWVAGHSTWPRTRAPFQACSEHVGLIKLQLHLQRRSKPHFFPTPLAAEYRKLLNSFNRSTSCLTEGVGCCHSAQQRRVTRTEARRRGVSRRLVACPSEIHRDPVHAALHRGSLAARPSGAWKKRSMKTGPTVNPTSAGGAQKLVPGDPSLELTPLTL